MNTGILRRVALFKTPTVLTAIFVCLAFPAILLSTANPALNQAGWLDPYVYAGYIHDYSGTVARFGPTYYSTRVAYIFPEYIFNSVFGLVPGYYLIRFVFLVSASATLYAIALRFYSHATAALTVAWLCLMPWLPRSLLWTHYDGFGVVYMLIGIGFILVPKRKCIAGHVIAGIFFALSVNCSLFMFSICGLLGLGWIFYYRHNGLWWLSRAVAALTAGFIMTYAVMSMLVYWSHPIFGPFFEIVTLRTTLDLLSGTMTNWFVPLSVIVERTHAYGLMVPPGLLMIALAIIAKGRNQIFHADRGQLQTFVLPYLTAVIFLALGMHFIFHSGWLSYIHTVVCFLPGCALAFIVISGEAERRGGAFYGKLAVYSGIALVLLSWLAGPYFPNLGVEFNTIFWLGIVAIAIVMALMLPHVLAAAPVLIVCTTALTFTFYLHVDPASGKRNYDVHSASTQDNIAEWDVYNGAIALQKFVDSNVTPEQTIGFWYSNSVADKWLNSIQSTFLWGYSRLFSDAAGEQGMPNADDKFQKLALSRRYIVLLGRTERAVENGRAALAKAELFPHDIARKRFQGRVWGYSALIVDLNPPPPKLGQLLFSVPLSELHPVNGGTAVPSSDGGLALTTAQQQWSYSFTISLLQNADAIAGPATVRVRLEAEKGSSSICVSTAGNISNLIREVPVPLKSGSQEIDIEVPDLSAAGLLIIRNISAAGASKVKVFSADVFRPK